MEEPGDVTVLLRRMGAGDGNAADDLLPLLYRELRALARGYMRGQKPGHTLQTTALMHEAWIKLVGPGVEDFDDRRHFLRVAARAMRSVLVDNARGKAAEKRGGGFERVPLEEGLTMDGSSSDLVLAVDEALTRLKALDADLTRVAELRCFGGLSSAEAADVLQVSKRTVERAWRTARAWLQRELEGGGEAHEA
ncbi:MAG: ECF-type sigma factor [Planctomycetota bacterium]